MNPDPDALAYYLANFCDVCDARLTEAERAAGPRFDQSLCDHCNAEFIEANDPHSAALRRNLAVLDDVLEQTRPYLMDPK